MLDHSIRSLQAGPTNASEPDFALSRIAAPHPRQNILIAHFDLFRNVGGGQSVYRALIESRPHDLFHYFRREEAADAPRPANAVGIPWEPVYLGTQDPLPSSIAHFFYVYVECRNMAASVARNCPGMSFDVVDVPDFSQAGLFLSQTLLAEGIRVGMTAVAMHGTLSEAFRGGWPGGGGQSRLLAELRMRERLQYRAANARYAISDAYARHWQHIVPMPINRLDPLCIAGLPAPTAPKPSNEPPDLAFVGRREKWKGPDLFLDLAWALDPSLYGRLILAGPDGPNHHGVGSMSFLPHVAKLRGIHPEMLGNVAPPALKQMYDARTVVLLPSRHDTFNLVALEAVLRGCPVHVSRRAGVADWLTTALPELPWLVADIDCSRSAASQTAETLRHYDRRRGELVEALSRRPLHPDFNTMSDIYAPSGEIDLAARQSTIDLAARFSTLVKLSTPSLPRTMAKSANTSLRQAAKWISPVIPARLRGLGGGARALAAARNGVRHWNARQFVKEHLESATGLSPRTVAQIVATRRNEGHRRDLLASNESRVADLRVRLKNLSRRVPQNLINRVPLFLEMARLERRIGNDLTAATYMLRVMRWLGRDVHGDLPFVAETLRDQGFPHEADAADAMFGSSEDAAGNCLDLVRGAYNRNRHRPQKPLAVLDDRRGTEPRRVAVIASLYNAADKLPTLLSMLARQSLAERGELEVVLVDSNSPADERGAMEASLRTQALPVVYARSAERETIQAAWNRGIGLSRAPYLCFLGADEGLHPDALRQLAAALDADPGVDWAMADSLVTNVDRDGVYESDIMPYDRRGYRQDLVYLETCYLSWVGGLYRRSIHERFGYYDESFRAAGDTEFKNRIMPHIRSVHVPKMLGIFNNYPEERTTQHPRAEIEDLRAWYLWRSQGGLRYAFDQRPAEDAADLLRSALNYRKSYCGHLSSDFDMADALAGYLAERPDAPSWTKAVRAEIGETLNLVRSIEQLPVDLMSGPNGMAAMAWAYSRVRAVRQRGARHQQLLGLASAPLYEVFNDNRHEQHWWSWSG